MNDGVFGDGWHLLGIGSADYEAATEEYVIPGATVEAFEAAAEDQGIDPTTATDLTTTATLYDDEGNIEEEFEVDYTAYMEAAAIEEPDPADYGILYRVSRILWQMAWMRSDAQTGSTD